MTTDNITTITSICIILLREMRVERGFHQAHVAEWMGKTTSAWTKIESGKSPLQFETFIRVCNNLQAIPSAVLATAERYASLLRQHNWVVLMSELEGNDALLNQAQEYWASPGCRNSVPSQGTFAPFLFSSILNGPFYGPDNQVTMAPVFRFVVDPLFREWQLKYQPPPPVFS